jgi:hypothetical protein
VAIELVGGGDGIGKVLAVHALELGSRRDGIFLRVEIAQEIIERAIFQHEDDDMVEGIEKVGRLRSGLSHNFLALKLAMAVRWG